MILPFPSLLLGSPLSTEQRHMLRNPISIHLWAGLWVVYEGVVRRDPVHRPPVVIIHINAKSLTQQGRPEERKQTAEYLH